MLAGHGKEVALKSGVDTSITHSEERLSLELLNDCNNSVLCVEGGREDAVGWVEGGREDAVGWVEKGDVNGVEGRGRFFSTGGSPISS